MWHIMLELGVCNQRRKFFITEDYTKLPVFPVFAVCIAVLLQTAESQNWEKVVHELVSLKFDGRLQPNAHFKQSTLVVFKYTTQLKQLMLLVHLTHLQNMSIVHVLETL